jgi:alkanesulfonate monooxygenase SsuD/methylene tetrahydromethanopterin reductase-like flavin-dependent oxidoreductase (luciferase family)
MRLGIYLDMRNPLPWSSAWSDLYDSTIDLVTEAEQRGAGAVWLTEHHGAVDGYLSQPLTFAAALAARTRTIRIGTAVVLAPLRHPRHLAEEAALVDVLSKGRLELGLGAGYARPEFDLFGVAERDRYQLTEDALRQLRDLFADGVFAPPPVQSEIPIWLGYQGPRGARTAGALDVGLLSVDRGLASIYQTARAAAGHAGPGRVGGVVNMVFSRDPDRAPVDLLPHLAYHLNSYRRMMTAARTAKPPRVLEVDELRRELAATGVVRGYRILDADRAVRELRAMTDGLPVEHLFFWCRIGGMPDKLVDEHLDVLFGDVAPALLGSAQT